MRVGTERLVVLALIMVVTLSGATFIGSKPTNLPYTAETTLRLSLDGNTTTVRNDLRNAGLQMIFSTAAGEERAGQRIELFNTSAKDVRVEGLRSSSESFILETDQPSNFEIAPGMTKFVSVAFTSTAVGVHTGALQFDLNGAPVSIKLQGLNAKGVEGGNEPNLQTIFDALGYDIDVAMPTTVPDIEEVSKDDLLNAIGSNKSASGDEVLVKGFTRADTTKPVSMVPLANYVHRSTDDFGWFGINQLGSAVQTQSVLSFRGGKGTFGGQNQQLLPGLGDGTYADLVAGSATSFVPQFERFGIWDGARSNFSEDSLNDAGDHSMRVYPAIEANGTVVPNAYIVADDAGQPGYKNFDYQDVIFLVTNVRAL